MAFSKKRGRPTTKIPGKDRGTKELREKQQQNITIEPIDLCLKKGFVTQIQHEAAMRFRWLYTLKFGSPDVSAYSYDATHSIFERNDDERWVQARYFEYIRAITELDKYNAKNLVMNICIYNQFASFMLPYTTITSKNDLEIRRQQLSVFKDGMFGLQEVLGTDKL